MVKDNLIKVLSTERSVAVGGLDLKHTARDLENRDIKGTTTKVVHGNSLTVLLVHAKRQCGGSGLVNDTKHVQTGNLARVLGRLTLSIVEVGRHSDDGLGNIATEVSVSGLLHLGEHKCTNLGWRVLLAHRLDPGIAVGTANDLVRQILLVLLGGRIVVTTTNQTLRREQSVLGIGHGLTLSGNSNQSLTVGGERHDGGGCSDALRVFNDFRTRTFHNRNTGVRGTQIDTDHISSDLITEDIRGREEPGTHQSLGGTQ